MVNVVKILKQASTIFTPLTVKCTLCLPVKVGPLCYLTLPYLTFEVDAARGSIQHSGHQVGPLRIPLCYQYLDIFIAGRIQWKCHCHWLHVNSGVCLLVCYCPDVQQIMQLGFGFFTMSEAVGLLVCV